MVLLFSNSPTFITTKYIPSKIILEDAFPEKNPTT